MVRGGRGAVSFTRWPPNHYSLKKEADDTLRNIDYQGTMGLNCMIHFGDFIMVTLYINMMLHASTALI